MTDRTRRAKLPRSWEELEQMAGIARNQPPALTQSDVERLRWKKIPSWGRRRKKFYGP